MEAGFLLGNNASKKNGLAAKVNPVSEVCSHGVDYVTKANSNTNSMKPTHTTPVTKTVVTIDDNATRKLNPNVKLGLGSDGATKQGDADGTNDSIFKQVHLKKVHVSVLINEEKVLGANVAIPIVVVDEMSEKFANTLYVYFIGEGLAFPIVKAYVKNDWAKGPWFIRSMPIFLNVWLANTKLKREEITKVLVELSYECDVLETIGVAIPLPKGEGYYLETLDVEYEWWPPRCSKCKIFDHEDEDCPSRVKKTCSDSLSREGGLRDAGIQHKKQGTNKAVKKQGFMFNKPKNNLIYRPVSKPSTPTEITSKPDSNAPPVSKEVVNGDDIELNVSQRVTMNEFSCPTNENGYFKDEINLGQLGSHMDKRMDKGKVLELNTNNITYGVVDTMNSAPNPKDMSTNTKSVPAKVKSMIAET
ncbi:hypothetical protein Tco_0383156 [Tanacetum coccineum]